MSKLCMHFAWRLERNNYCQKELSIASENPGNSSQQRCSIECRPVCLCVMADVCNGGSWSHVLLYRAEGCM